MTPPGFDRLMPLVRRGDRPVALMVPGAGGGLQPYLRLAGALGKTHNVYGILAVGLLAGEEPEDDVAAMAESTLRAVDNAGITPDLLFGWSMGGAISWEVCVRLAARGIRPELVMLDSSPLPRTATEQENEWLLDRVTAMLGDRADADMVVRVRRTLAGQIAALTDHRVDQPYDGRVLLISCTDPDRMRAPSIDHWRQLASDLREERVDADHFEVFDPAYLPALTELLRPFVGRAEESVR